MIKTENISYTYSGSTALKFPDLAAEAGDSLLILGQSGCGKTTLLHILGGLLMPPVGMVNIKGQSLYGLSSGSRDRFRGQNIGIIFQKPHFVRALTVEENLLLCQGLAGLAKDKKTVRRILDALNIGHKAKSKTHNLSQGEQQRAAIARAIVNKPALILADEPTSALDDVNTDEVVQLLEGQAKENGAALLIVTHDNRLKEHFPERIEL